MTVSTANWIDPRGGLFLSWWDGDKKKHPRQKLAEAIERYVEKFGTTPRLCFTSAQDALDLAAPSRKFPGELPVQVNARSYIAKSTFYIGDDGGEVAA